MNAKVKDDIEEKVKNEQLSIDTKLSSGLQGNANYKLIGYFDRHKSNEAAKIEEYLNKKHYVGMAIDNGIVAVYRKSDRRYNRRARYGEVRNLILGSIRFVTDELTPYAIDTLADFILKHSKKK